MTPRATYRVQLTKQFPFAAARAVIPYLADLGVSHLYASPITTARQGSTHGYDVIDPTRINPELGGEDGFRQLVAALRAHGMGIIIDIVPNHMGVAGGENPWWNDVLRLGPTSPFACYFDIDWNGPLKLPILGGPLAAVIAQGDLVVGSAGAPHLLLYGEQKLPLRPDGPQQGDIATIAEAQHYALIHWRTAGDQLNWRRFFSINDLAGVRVEDPAVFEATHGLYFHLYQEGLIDGLRIDHVDGLSDPARYCRRLRSRMDQIRPGAIILVEKIVGPGEMLPPDWGVEGTSGYDFMRDVTALLHDPIGETPLASLWEALDPDQSDPQDVVRRAKRDMLEWQFEAQLAACVHAFSAVAQSSGQAAIMAWTEPMLRRSISCLLQAFPVYRTYGDGQSAPASDEEVRLEAWEAAKPSLPPGERPVGQQILAWLAGDGPGQSELAAEAVRRFQQLSAPIAAKGVEDTAFIAGHHYCQPMRLDRRRRNFPFRRRNFIAGSFSGPASSRRPCSRPRPMIISAVRIAAPALRYSAACQISGSIMSKDGLNAPGRIMATFILPIAISFSRPCLALGTAQAILLPIWIASLPGNKRRSGRPGFAPAGRNHASTMKKRLPILYVILLEPPTSETIWSA